MRLKLLDFIIVMFFVASADFYFIVIESPQSMQDGVMTSSEASAGSLSSQ